MYLMNTLYLSYYNIIKTIMQNLCSLFFEKLFKSILTNKCLVCIIQIRNKCSYHMFDDHRMIRRYTSMIEMDLTYLIRYFLRGIIRRIRRNSIAVAVGIFLFCALFLSIGIITTKAAAMKSEPRVKQVISMRIQKGDTLWSIAKEYITDDYEDLNDYIREIKSSNGITSDTIHAGAYLIIPHYTSSSK